MLLPLLQGNLSCNNFFIYTACDQKYFDEFAVPFVNSCKANAGCELHLHIYNPRMDQVAFCDKKDISFSYEYINLDQFDLFADKWISVSDDIEKSRYDRILGAMQKSNDKNIQERLIKTYFACARFIRLNQLVSQNSSFLAVDIDAVVRKPVLPILDNLDLYMHKIFGKKERTLAGALMINRSNGLDFLKKYSNVLENYIANNYLYWGIDQDVLPDLLDQFQVGQLPLSYIDWTMNQESNIWTAKGKRKELNIFISEQQKYKI